MEARIFAVFMGIELVVLGGICLLYPRIARRGLLFGVYVGEAASRGEDARRITTAWYRGMIAVLVVSLVVGAALVLARPGPALAMIPTFGMIGGFFVLYLRAYRRALALAPQSPPALGAAPLVSSPSLTALPVVVIAVCLVLALFSLAYAIAFYPRLPERIPVHFGGNGRPDGWTTKSVGSVFATPLLNLVLAVLLGGATFFTARAKQTIRQPEGGISLRAQERFRNAMTRYMAGVAVLTLGMTSWLGVGSIRVARGEAEGLGAAVLFLAGAMILYVVGGVVYLMVRYGQGGARLEAGADATPLSDGLADNRCWKLGLFYVNREDPSFFVEHRFGFGYTLNFGNSRAVLFVVGSLIALIALLAWVVVATARG